MGKLSELFNNNRGSLSPASLQSLIARKYGSFSLTGSAINSILKGDTDIGLQARSLIALCEVLSIPYDQAIHALREDMRPND